MTSTISFIAMLISLALLTFSTLNDLRVLKVIFKTVTSLLFLVIAHISHKENSIRTTSTYYKFIFSGLFFSMIGDILLVVAQNSGILFVFGVASFACGHICYIIAFFQFGKLDFTNLIWFICIFAPLLLLMNKDDWFTFGALKPLIFGYGVLLSLMAAKSISLWKYRHENAYFVYLNILAAFFFLISDTILLFSIFGHTGFEHLEAVNNVIYYIGQGLFGLSFKKELLIKEQK